MVQIFLQIGVLTTLASSFAMPPVSAFEPAVIEQTVAEQHYVVQEDELLCAVARKFNVLETELREINNLSSGERVIAGQDLIIPEGVWKSYEGVASWYGPGFHGKVMANGEIYNQNKILVAHRTAPLGSKLKITNLENGKFIIAPVLDRGPYTNEDGEYTRDIDLSYAVAKELGTIGQGLASVRIEVVDESEKGKMELVEKDKNTV